MCQLQRQMLPQLGPHRTQRQPRRMRAVLPTALHDGRRGRTDDSPRQALAFAPRYEPFGRPRGHDCRRCLLAQDRGPTERRGLREECHRLLSPATRRDSGARSVAPTGVRRTIHLHLRAAAGEELQPRLHRLFPPWAHARYHLVRHAQIDRRTPWARQCESWRRTRRRRHKAAPQRRRAGLLQPAW